MFKRYYVRDMRDHLPVAERRELLLDAAQRIARRGGIGAVTVRAVATEAGVAAGVVHYCFEDKKALLAALSQRLVEQNTFGGALPDSFGEWLGDGSGVDYESAVRMGLQALWQAIAASPPDQVLTYELMTLAMRDDTALPAALDQFAFGQQAAAGLLEALAGVCGVEYRRPMSELAGEAVSWFDGIVLRWLLDHDDEQVQRQLDSVAKHLTAATVPALRPSVQG